MSNKHRGVVATPIELDGIALSLRFGNNEIVELEEALGMPIHKVMGDLEDLAPSRRFIRAALYAGISGDTRFSTGRNRGTTLTRIGRLLDKLSQDEMATLVKSLLRALLLAHGADIEAVDAAMAQGDGEGSPDPLGEEEPRAPSSRP